MSDTKNTFFQCSDITKIRHNVTGCCNITFEEVKCVEKLFEEFWWMGTPVPKPIVVLGSFEALKKPLVSDFVLKASDKVFKPEILKDHKVTFHTSDAYYEAINDFINKLGK